MIFAIAPVQRRRGIGTNLPTTALTLCEHVAAPSAAAKLDKIMVCQREKEVAIRFRQIITEGTK